jgi:hypothetical protein
MKFRFTLVVWGDWHLDQLVKHGLPSLRAPGNLDAVDYLISAKTRPADLGRVTAALDGLNAAVDAPLPDGIAGDQANSTVFRMNHDDRAAAAAAGEVWALLAPDMVWGEGTLAHHRLAFEAGKKAIFRPLLRVDSDRAGTIRDFGKRSLAAVAIESEHDVSRRYYRAGGKFFSPHAEMIIWDAPGGLLNRTITSEVQTCVANGVQISERNACDSDLVGQKCVVADSDEAITLAMCPPDKDFEWTRRAEPLSPALVRSFMSSYPSAASREIARTPYRLHAGDVDPAAWADVERRSGEFVEEVLG